MAPVLAAGAVQLLGLVPDLAVEVLPPPSGSPGPGVCASGARPGVRTRRPVCWIASCWEPVRLLGRGAQVVPSDAPQVTWRRAAGGLPRPRLVPAVFRNRHTKLTWTAGTRWSPPRPSCATRSSTSSTTASGPWCGRCWSSPATEALGPGLSLPPPGRAALRSAWNGQDRLLRLTLSFSF